MRLRTGRQGASAAAKSFTIAVMAAAMAAQLLSISHEMTVRHFRCAEHGELTHVATLSAAAAELPAQRSDSAFRARDGESPDAHAHEHCGVTFTVAGSSCRPSTGGAIAAAPPVPTPRPAPSAVSWRGRAFVLASAPKTSPPSA
jgi:hypothetical protein